MADIISLTQLANAITDAQTLADAINGNDQLDVTSRLGATYPSLAKAIKLIMQKAPINSTPFATKTALLADTTLADNAFAFVYNDALKDNGLYKKVAGAWEYQNWNPLAESKLFAESLLGYADVIKNVTSYKFVNLVNPDETVMGVIDTSGNLDNTTAENAYITTGFIPVVADKNIQLLAKNSQTAWANIAAYDINKKYIGRIGLPSSAWQTGLTSLKVPSLVDGYKPYYLRLTNLTAYNTANDLFVGIGEVSPSEIVKFDANKLITSYSNIAVIDAIKNKSEFIKVNNLLKPDHTGTLGYLGNGLDPQTSDAYAKNFLTTDWISIPSDTKFIVIVGCIYSYVVASASDVYLSRVESDVEIDNVTTLIDLSKSTKGTTPTRIRVSFRRLGADTNAQQTETWSKCGIYATRASIGSAISSLYVHNYQFDENIQLPSDTVYVNNLLDIARNRVYPISSWGTGFKTGYLGDNNILVTTGDYYTTWATTPALVCEPNSKYAVFGGNFYVVAFLDYDKKFISTYYATSAQTFVTPSNACYYRISVVNPTKDETAVYQLPADFSNDLPVVHDKQFATLRSVITLPNDSKSIKGKTWVAMGDSITASSVSYANQLATRHSVTLVKHAKDGARIHREAPDNPWLVLAEEYLNIAVTPDIITIAGGTNDPMQTGQLGTFSDRTISTFYGALHVLLSGLREKFTDARIGYIAPIQRSDMRYIDGDTTSIPYLRYKAIKEVCGYYGIPVWNGCTEFSANPSDTKWCAKYMPDGLHPNFVGHTWYANRVEQFILNLAK